MPVARAAIQAFLTVAVAVNGYANGKYMADNSSIPIPSYVPFSEYAVKLFANTASSSSLNYFPAMKPFDSLVPIKSLQDPNKPSSTARMVGKFGSDEGKEEETPGFNFDKEASRYGAPYNVHERPGADAYKADLKTPLLGRQEVPAI